MTADAPKTLSIDLAEGFSIAVRCGAAEACLHMVADLAFTDAPGDCIINAEARLGRIRRVLTEAGWARS